MRRARMCEFLVVLCVVGAGILSALIANSNFFNDEVSSDDLRAACYRSGGMEYRQHTGLFIGGRVCIYQKR